MNDVQPFSRDAIEEHLRRSNIQFLLDEDGRYLAIHPPTARRTVDLHAWYSAEGPSQQVYSIRVTTPRYYPAEDTPLLLSRLNLWHCEMRWPKVYLMPSVEPPWLRLLAEAHLDLTCGLHPAAFDHFSLTTVAIADTFFCWIEAEDRGIDFTELERWLRDGG